MMRIDLATRLDLALRAAAVPIDGVSIGDPTDRTTWRIDFARRATAQDRLTAAIVLATFDVSDPPPAPVVRPLTPVRKVDFLRLLLPGEYAAFVRAGEAGDDTLLYARALFEAAPELKLDDPTFLELLQAVIAKGVLTSERAAAILAALTTPA
jgi:hypothetical protein